MEKIIITFDKKPLPSLQLGKMGHIWNIFYKVALHSVFTFSRYEIDWSVVSVIFYGNWNEDRAVFCVHADLPF